MRHTVAPTEYLFVSIVTEKQPLIGFLILRRFFKHLNKWSNKNKDKSKMLTDSHYKLFTI